MNDTDKDAAAPTQARDPLGELIRAAGRRPPPPAEHYQTVFAASRSAWQAKVRSRRQRRWVYALAASLVVACGSILVFEAVQRFAPSPIATLAIASGDVAVFSSAAGGWQPSSSFDAQLFSGDTLRTGANGRAALTIAGAGSLRVSSQTELLLSGPSSMELISGTVYIDSGDRQLSEPIEIATRFGVVRDIGTQFEVRSTTSALRVRVRTGAVLLVDSLHAADVQGSAGEEFQLSASGALELADIAPDAAQWEWAAMLAVVPVIENNLIIGYLQWIARETGKSLRFDSQSTELRAQFERWNGDMRGLTPLEVLYSIAAASDFEYELTNDGTMLIRRE
jgi:hypothetical protein